MSTEVDPETNPFGPGVDNPGADEDIEQTEMENRNPYDSSSRRGSVDPTSPHRTYGKTSFGGDASDTAPLPEREENIEDAWDIIKREFPNFNPANSPFTARLDEFGQVIVRLNRDRGKYYPLFKADGELNDKLPKTIIKSIGPPDVEIVETNREKITRSQEIIAESQEQLATTSDENVREVHPNYC